MKLLLQGIDTLQCAYYLRKIGSGGIDFHALGTRKEDLRNRKYKDPEMVEIGNEKFLLHPYGTTSGISRSSAASSTIHPSS